MHSLAVMDDILGLSPLEEVAYIIIQVRSLSLRHRKPVCIPVRRATTFICEKIHLVARPSSREVHTETAMSHAEVA